IIYFLMLLQHEKYTNQLHMGLKASEEKRQDLQEERSKLERFERKGLTEAPVPRPTPLYGQPSWWGEEDLGNKGPDNESSEVSGSLQDFHDSQSKSAFVYHREPSYFEIPTKEFPTHPVTPAVELNDFPTKDTNALLTPTPPVVQSHASFTIEFDECTPGKIKIKDHVTKFSSHQRSKQQQNRKPLATAPVDVLSAESKVADWLVQSDVSMIHRRPPCDDVYSTKSDLAMHIRTLKGKNGHHHEDGTQSDSEDPDFYVHPEKNDATHVEETTSLTESLVKSGHRETLSQQAFIIEFLDDNPRKKRSQSFTHNPAHAETYSALKAKLDRRKGGAYGERPASVHGHIPATQQITVPLKGSSHSGLQRSSSLKREKTEEPINRSSISPSSSGPSSRCSPAITSKPFGSVGKKSKMAQDFSAELHKDSEQISPSPKSAPPVMVSPAHNLLTPSPPNTCGPSSVSYTSSPSQLPALSQAIFSSSSPVTVPSHQPTLSLVSSTSPDGSCKSDTFRIAALSQTDRDPSLKLPPTTVLIRHLSSHEPRRPVKPNSSAPNLQNQERDAVFSKEHYSSSFVRQESFTKDRPSDNIQVKRLPHISSHPALRDLGTGGSDSALSDDMRNLVSQESKQAVSAQPCKNGGSLGQADDSLSGESDVDTASSVSVVSSKNAPVSASIKRTSSNGLCKDKCASSLSAQPTARDRLSEKRRNHATADNTAKAEVAHHFQLHHSAGNRASLDLSENQNSHGQQLWPDTAASDHESCSRPANHKKLTGTLQKEDIRKSNKAGLQVLTRSNSLSAPRPTRASMLRRARLGDTSDNEGAETDRGSQSSEHTKIPGDGKKLSRLDILAMPRKRTGSFTAPSDNESISVKPGTPSRAAESSISGRKLSSGEPKQTTIKGTSAVEKHSSMRTRTSQAKHNSTNSEYEPNKFFSDTHCTYL
uniref:CEP170 C-terminal domain-containing protein n=1 Tax=Electrophorus electricus TaxID=8005 RepID=A0AAY5EHY0_ELEEL